MVSLAADRRQCRKFVQRIVKAPHGVWQFTFTELHTRQILRVKWYDHVKNSYIAATTSLPNVNDIMARRRLALFGHVVRLDANTPAHQVLKQGVDVKSEHWPNAQWRRPPGRPRSYWLQQINNGSLTGIRQSWRAAEDHGHRWSLLAMCHDNDDDDELHKPHVAGSTLLTRLTRAWKKAATAVALHNSLTRSILPLVDVEVLGMLSLTRSTPIRIASSSSLRDSWQF